MALRLKKMITLNERKPNPVVLIYKHVVNGTHEIWLEYTADNNNSDHLKMLPLYYYLQLS